MGDLSSVFTFQNLMIVSNLLISMFVTALFIPIFINKLVENNIVAKDQYKRNLTFVVDRGRNAIKLIAMLSIFINSLFLKFTSTNYMALIVILLFGLFGVLDDMINIGRCLNCL